MSDRRLSMFLRQWVSRLILDVNAIFSIFWCQNELILLYPQLFKDFFIKLKHCFFKFKEFSRRKSFSRSFQGPTSFSRTIPGPCKPCKSVAILTVKIARVFILHKLSKYTRTCKTNWEHFAWVQFVAHKLKKNLYIAYPMKRKGTGCLKKKKNYRKLDYS